MRGINLSGSGSLRRINLIVWRHVQNQPRWQWLTAWDQLGSGGSLSGTKQPSSGALRGIKLGGPCLLRGSKLSNGGPLCETKDGVCSPLPP